MSGVNDTHNAAAPGSQRTHSVIVNLIAWAVIAVGSLVLASWVLDIEAGKRLLPGFQSMKFNTALCLVACGLVLWRRAPASASASDPIAAFLALFIFVISGFTLFEYGSGWLLGIDNLVIFDTATAPDNWPGRMSGATALCFSMIGAAWLISMIPMRHSTLILQLFALAVTIVSAAALIGYVFGVREFRLPLFSTMALHTAVLLFLCGLGMLLRGRPDELCYQSLHWWPFAAAPASVYCSDSNSCELVEHAGRVGWPLFRCIRLRTEQSVQHPGAGLCQLAWCRRAQL